MKKIIINICSVFILFSIANGLFAQESKGSFSFDCKTCHECDTPTKSNPCLISCPRHTLITIHHSPEEGPRIDIDG